MEGLRCAPRRLPCKYFYDQRGSDLFEAICQLDEYYLTRTELAIMRDHAPEMAAAIGPGAMLVELGSGSGIKTQLLLDQLTKPISYVPVDIASDYLQKTAARLARSYPQLKIEPVCADFTQDFSLPTEVDAVTNCVVYFPGSTIGNFGPESANRLLARIAAISGPGGKLLIGIDLVKQPEILEAAYNDADGITAQFNLNLLTRMNRELGADFAVERFDHVAVYNQAANRIEMYLVSKADQTVQIDNEKFRVGQGERICTEHSHKYTINGFAQMAADVGMTLRRQWMDDQQLFAVLQFAAT